MTAETYEKSWTHEGRPELYRRDRSPVAGPWEHEPDKVHWVDPATDLDCLAVRGPVGAWCGYVGLPPGHPWHGTGYSSCLQDECAEEWCPQHTPEARVAVHGGLTFASSCNESDRGEGFGICHVPLPGRPHDVWWFGFDCAHSGDLTPHNASDPAWPTYREHEVYRDLTYLKAECARLAGQLAAVTA